MDDQKYWNVLQDAINKEKAAEFMYRKDEKGALVELRHIIPTGVELTAKGHRTVICYDLERRDIRRYRLDRIHGPITFYEKPPEGYSDDDVMPTPQTTTGVYDPWI